MARKIFQGPRYGQVAALVRCVCQRCRAPLELRPLPRLLRIRNRCASSGRTACSDFSDALCEIRNAPLAAIGPHCSMASPRGVRRAPARCTAVGAASLACGARARSERPCGAGCLVSGGQLFRLAHRVPPARELRREPPGPARSADGPRGKDARQMVSARVAAVDASSSRPSSISARRETRLRRGNVLVVRRQRSA